MTTIVGTCIARVELITETCWPYGQYSSEDHIFENQQSTGKDSDEELSNFDSSHTGEANYESHTTYHDLEEDLVYIVDKYVNIADKMQEMVCGSLGYVVYNSSELENLNKCVEDMKTSLYPGYKQKMDKVITSLKLLQLKVTHHMAVRGFKALLDLLRDMLPEKNEIPMTTYI